MAARHPAQRHPLEHDADGRSPTPHLRDTTTAHVSGGNSTSVSSADDARGDNTRSASLNPTRATSPRQSRLTPGAYRRPSPPYVRNGLLHRDYVSDDEDTPMNAAPTRRSPTTSGVHRSPSDDGRGEQRGGSPAPTRSATRPQRPETPATRRQGSGGPVQGTGPAGVETLHQSDTRSVSPRVGHITGRAGTSNLGDSSIRTSSGTPPLHPPLSSTTTAMPRDVPYVPPSRSARLPVFQFNSARYPAYDVHARRIGLEHTRIETSLPPPGQHYLPRTHHYPGPDVSPSDYPHVMSMNLDLNLLAEAASERAILVDESVAPSSRASSSRRARTRTPSPLPFEPEHYREPSLPPQPAPREPSFSPPPKPAPEPEPVVQPVEEIQIPHQQSPPPIPDPVPMDESEDEGEAEADADVEMSEESEYDDDVNSTPNLRRMLGLRPDADISLNVLADPVAGEKPNYPYPTLIKLAIHGSPNRRLTLQEIYQALMRRFRWYRDNARDRSWQNSIRHNLSLNKCFRKVARPITEPGKGHFWTVDYSDGVGNKRERKRNKKPTKAQLLQMEQEARMEIETQMEQGQPQAGPSRLGAAVRNPTFTVSPPPLPVAGRGARRGAGRGMGRGTNIRARPYPPRGAGRGQDPPEHADAECEVRRGPRAKPKPLSTRSTPSMSMSGPSMAGSSRAGPSMGGPSMGGPVGDSAIDPALRDEGHRAGENRTRPGVPARTRSVPYPPSASLRQSSRDAAAHARDQYESGMSRSLSPPYATSATRSTVQHYGNYGSYSSMVPPRTDGPVTRSQQHMFGQGSFSAVPTYTMPGPPLPGPQLNWIPYGGPPPPRPPRAPSNALMLSGVPSSNTTGFVSYSPQPVAGPSRPRRPPVASSSRAGSEYAESSRSRRSTGGRVYTDSRGREYPRQGDSYSSGSE